MIRNDKFAMLKFGKSISFHELQRKSLGCSFNLQSIHLLHRKCLQLSRTKLYMGLIHPISICQGSVEPSSQMGDQWLDNLTPEAPQLCLPSPLFSHHFQVCFFFPLILFHRNIENKVIRSYSVDTIMTIQGQRRSSCQELILNTLPWTCFNVKALLCTRMIFLPRHPNVFVCDKWFRFHWYQSLLILCCSTTF